LSHRRRGAPPRRAPLAPRRAGELNWVKRMVSKHHEEARAKGVKVKGALHGLRPPADHVTGSRPPRADLPPPPRSAPRARRVPCINMGTAVRRCSRPRCWAWRALVLGPSPASLCSALPARTPSAPLPPPPPPPSLPPKVVHCCGYDSVPFDIGALVVVDHIRSKLGK
jgi:hypothetical protein